ncbi:uncharacterized protein LOC132703712 [Cylas formicarius]|uniref:uncharacterized protein LOC132703712 n=1 Tax=Cylas formicarius TaxID=197179 RepID=UPI002958DE81|nr:uncharacterized protein LOC132703712 [Cylas formicarius]
MTNLLTLCLFFAIATYLVAGENLFDCPDPTLATQLVCDKDISEDGFFLTVKSKEITCPDSILNSIPITCIDIRDLDSDNRGGSVKVKDGGINYNQVTVELTSKLGQGLHFNVKVYGQSA